MSAPSAPPPSSRSSVPAVDVNSHALPPPPDAASPLDNASNPLSILALMEEATAGLAPKLVAGGLSCMIISAVLNPMDVIKVRLQTQRSVGGAGDSAAYRGFFHAFRTIWAQEGYWRGLMRGLTPSMLREASYSSLRMGLYDAVKLLLAPRGAGKDDFTLLHKLLAGCISGGVGSVLATPTDLVKIRFQGYSAAQPNPHPHSFAAFAAIYRHEGGLRGLYRGASPTVVRAALLTGSQLSSYDHSKRAMLRAGLADTPATHFAASVVSGLITTTVTNPVDMVKTRVMNDPLRRYAGPLDCIMQTLRHEGPQAFLKGWSANYGRLGPHFIVSLPLAEAIRVRLGADSF